MGGSRTRSILLAEDALTTTGQDSSNRLNMSEYNFDDGTYFSERNIWFSSSNYKPVNTSEYDRPVLASNRSGIDNL